MLFETYFKTFISSATCEVRLLVVLLTILPATSSADIIWSGDYSTGDFTQWHQASGPGTITFGQVPKYGRPIQYGSQDNDNVGDGSLLSLVAKRAQTVNGVFYPQGPTRGGDYAAKVTVKNSINGIESSTDPSDCDGNSTKNCDRRRTELTMQLTLPDYYNGLPYLGERWLSVSHYIPSNWSDGGSGSAPTVYQLKPRNEYGLSPCFQISINNGNWTIKNRWSPLENPDPSDVPWQYVMYYTGNEDGGPYPRADFWPDGLADFPDVAASQAALQSVNKGGWTDWLIHVKFDARGAGDGGTGFLTIWKREDSGPWIKVLHILPKVTTRGGLTFDHGICYNSPPTSGNNGGFGIKAGLYMDRDQVWGLPENRVIYNANIKVGDENTNFADMSPDGSTPGSTSQQSPPEPPMLLSTQ